MSTTTFTIVCTDPREAILSKLSQHPTDVYGLKWKASIQPHEEDDKDLPMWNLWGSPYWFWPNPEFEITPGNLEVCQQTMDYLKDRCNVIVEIGVHRNGSNSMTHVYLKNKTKDCIYLGIDIENKEFLNNAEENIHTIIANSHEQDRIREKLRELGVTKIDLLAIDGWHSINTAFNDWEYTDMLSDHGVVVLHDTNIHAGPVALFEAVNEQLFEKQRYFPEYTDFGIATFKHLK